MKYGSRRPLEAGVPVMSGVGLAMAQHYTPSGPRAGGETPISKLVCVFRASVFWGGAKRAWDGGLVSCFSQPEHYPTCP